MDSRSFTKRAREVATLLEQDLALESGSVGSDLVRAIVSALVSLGEQGCRESLASVAVTETTSLADRFVELGRDGSSQPVALLQVLAEPRGRLLMAAALGFVPYAVLAQLGRDDVSQQRFEGVPPLRKPPRRAVDVDLDARLQEPDWTSSDDFQDAVASSGRVAEGSDFTDPLVLRALCLSVIAGWQQPSGNKFVTPIYMAALRVRLTATLRDITHVAHLVTRQSETWEEATRLFDEFLVIGQRGHIAGYRIPGGQPPASAVAEAVEVCADLPDFTTFPSVGAADVKAAEAELGCHFPSHYVAFLRATNGMVQNGGRVQLFGVGSDAFMDVVSFNGPAGWLRDLPRDWVDTTDTIWVGATYDHALIGFDKSAAARERAGRERYWDPGAVIMDLRTRKEWRGRGMGGPFLRRQPAPDRLWREIKDAHGPLDSGQGLLLGVNHYLHDQVDLRGVKPLPLLDALRFAVELVREAEELKDPSAVLGIRTVPGLDAKRHARWSLATSQTAQ